MKYARCSIQEVALLCSIVIRTMIKSDPKGGRQQKEKRNSLSKNLAVTWRYFNLVWKPKIVWKYHSFLSMNAPMKIMKNLSIILLMPAKIFTLSKTKASRSDHILEEHLWWESECVLATQQLYFSGSRTQMLVLRRNIEILPHQTGSRR